MVCSGQLDLKTAQDEIAHDWIAAYKKYVGPEPGTTVERVPAPRNSTAAANPEGQVWVNTKSGVYWRPGTAYYGTTKQGKYMTEAEAIAEGFHPPGGK